MTEEELGKELNYLLVSAKILDVKIELVQCRLKQIRLIKELEEKEGEYV